jgi:predicted small secreted protein
MIKRLTALLMIISLGLLTGCNTIEGAGRDVERGGEKVQDAAKDVKRNM